MVELLTKVQAFDEAVSERELEMIPDLGPGEFSES